MTMPSPTRSMRIRARRLLCALFCTGLLAGHAQAGDDPALASLRQEIEQFILERSEVPPDSIWIPPLEDFALPGVDPAGVRVDLSTRARGAISGSVAVNVALADDRRVLKRGVVTARVHTSRPVVVATRSLRRGETLQAADLRLEKRDVGSVADEATDQLTPLIGMELRRRVRAGTPMRTSWVEPPAVVLRGQRVRILLNSPVLRIEGVGQALADGAVGEHIRVVNSDTGREISGRVGPDGAIHVSY